MRWAFGGGAHPHADAILRDLQTQGSESRGSNSLALRSQRRATTEKPSGPIGCVGGADGFCAPLFMAAQSVGPSSAIAPTSAIARTKVSVARHPAGGRHSPRV